MLSVPSVTMNGGSRRPVTSPPLIDAEGDAGEDRRAEAPAAAGIAAHDRELRHHDLPERHDRADREVDPRREDHQRLPDREHADDHHLLQDQREVLRLEESVRSSARRTPSSSTSAMNGPTVGAASHATDQIGVSPSWSQG